MNEVLNACKRLTTGYNEDSYKILLSFYNKWDKKSNYVAGETYALKSLSQINEFLTDHWDSFFNPALNRAAQLFEKEKYDESIEKYSVLLNYKFIKNQKTSYAHANNNLAMCYEKRGSLDDLLKALECYDVARKNYTVTQYKKDIDLCVERINQKIQGIEASSRGGEILSPATPLNFDLDLESDIPDEIFAKPGSGTHAIITESGTDTSIRVKNINTDQTSSGQKRVLEGANDSHLKNKALKVTPESSPNSGLNKSNFSQVNIPKIVSTNTQILPGPHDSISSITAISDVMILPEVSSSEEKIKELESQINFFRASYEKTQIENKQLMIKYEKQISECQELKDKCVQLEQVLEKTKKYYNELFSLESIKKIIKIQSFIRKNQSTQKAWQYILQDAFTAIHAKPSSNTSFAQLAAIGQFGEKMRVSHEKGNIEEAIKLLNLFKL